MLSEKSRGERARKRGIKDEEPLQNDVNRNGK